MKKTLTNHKNEHFTRVLVAGLIGLALFVAGCAAPTRGIVRGSDGNGLKGIAVRAYGPRLDADGKRDLLAETVTDDAGRFEFEHSRSVRPELLALVGNAGTGRVNVAHSKRDVSLNYPVRSTIAFLHDNDLHFNFNQQRRVSSLMDMARVRYDHVLIMNAGDILNRHPKTWNSTNEADYLSRACEMVGFLNKFNYDVMTPGNHELDYIGPWTRKALEQANFPLLAANIVIETELLPPMGTYKVFRLDNDQTIAVLGLSTVNFTKPGVSEKSPIETAMLYRGLAQSNTLFVGLTHIGYDVDLKLAKAMPEFDVIIGGHSHTLLPRAVVENGVLVAQAGGLGAGMVAGYKSIDPGRPKWLGVVVLNMENDRVVDKIGRVMTLSDQAALQIAWESVEVVGDSLKADGMPLKIGLRLENPSFTELDARVSFQEQDAAAKASEQRVLASGFQDTTISCDLAGFRSGDERILNVTVQAEGGTGENSKYSDSLRLIGLPHMKKSIAADGDLSDWKGTYWRREIKEGEIRAFPGRADIKGWGGELRAGWTDEGLCLGVIVADKDHFNTQTGADIWNGDAIQFCLAPTQGRERGKYSEQDLLGGLALTSSGVEYAQWNGPEIKGIKYGVKHNNAAGTTTYEWVVPLRELKIAAKAGETFALNVAALDDDAGKGAESWFELSRGILFGQDPSPFPIFILCK